MSSALLSLVQAVFVHYRTPEHLKSFLESFGRIYSEVDLTIVDHSGEGGEIIQAHLERVKKRGKGGNLRYLVDLSNPGFGAGVNHGFEGRSIRPFYLIGNVDTRPEPGCLEGLVVFLLKNPQAAVAGPRIYDSEGFIEVSFGPPISFIREVRLRWMTRNYQTSWVQRRLRRIRKPRKVGWVTGAWMLVRREVFEKLGGFDPRFFLYYEDCDFCERARKIGMTVWYVPGTGVTHVRGASVQKADNDWIQRRRRQSQWLYYLKHRPWLERQCLRLYLGFMGFDVSNRQEDG